MGNNNWAKVYRWARLLGILGFTVSMIGTTLAGKHETTALLAICLVIVAQQEKG